jgi:hypothetical protein
MVCQSTKLVQLGKPETIIVTRTLLQNKIFGKSIHCLPNM